MEKIKFSKQNKKTLLWILIVMVTIIALFVAAYFYTQAQIHFNYKGIEFEAVNEGTKADPLIFYQTNTILIGSDGEPFGFRIRTKPSELKKVPFENVENFELMKIGGFSFGNNTFNCEGDGVIAMANVYRLFQKTGMQMITDENASCDSQGRYNMFEFVYGDKTEIREIGNHCYEVVVKGSEDKCEILPATEKLMVEIYSKYGEL